MNKPTTIADDRPIYTVFYDRTGAEPFVEPLAHGRSTEGMPGLTNPVAVVGGRLCSRKRGCQWCTSLRDRIRSRTMR